MAVPRLLIDNDIFILLSGCGLLADTVALLGFTPAECARLDTLPYFLRGRKAARRFPQSVRNAALAACLEIPPVPSDFDPVIVERLTAVENMDGGEALLFAALAAQPASLLISGDKRALVAAASSTAIADLRPLFAGRVICLESIFALLVRLQGATSIAARLSPIIHLHKTTSILFSPGVVALQGDVEVGLDLYVASLRDQVGVDFLYTP